MTIQTPSKVLPTTGSKQDTKKAYIIKYNANNPQAPASEIAQKIKTTPSYVWKVLSEARKPSKDPRGRRGHVFAHGKVFYEWWVPRSWLVDLEAPVVNPLTGLKQLGFRKRDDPCSCQIHANGHLVVWSRSSGWRDWLVEAFSSCGWSQENARVVVDHVQLNISTVEVGVKPRDPGFLPKDLYLETEWGVVLVRDDSPEKGVLELKISIPNMQRYLGIPDIAKRLEVIEQGSITIAQRQRATEALLYALCKSLQRRSSTQDEEREQLTSI